MNNKKEFLEICSILYDIQTQTEMCIFLNVSGHVNKFNFTISKNKIDYLEKIYEKEWESLETKNLSKQKQIIKELELFKTKEPA